MQERRKQIIRLVAEEMKEFVKDGFDFGSGNKYLDKVVKAAVEASADTVLEDNVKMTTEQIDNELYLIMQAFAHLLSIDAQNKQIKNEAADLANADNKYSKIKNSVKLDN